MITNSDYNFTTPAGREFVLAAARFAAVNPSSRVLALSCGYGAGVLEIARDFRAQIIAVESRAGLIRETISLCENENVSHRVTPLDKTPLEYIGEFSDEPFDLVLIEDCLQNADEREIIISKLPQLVAPRGWAAFTDKIYITEQIPSSVQLVFGEPKKQTLDEAAYRELIKNADLDLQFIGLAPPCNWDNYYGHIAKRMTEKDGYFGSGQVKKTMNSEIKLFYRMDCLRYVASMMCICRRT